ncbi:MAG: insulinase family protein [Thermosynechococcaceae cyanobacterium MS004]|nr:insulinase family protein [Thermosynechococcaceae cyanobacterium MS004]
MRRFSLLTCLGFCFGLLCNLGFVWVYPAAIASIPPTAATMNTLTRGVQSTVLENGLTVLTKEIHTAPVVSVQVWYRVGSRNEEAGVNGISHQLEHLLFKGTESRPIQFGRLFSALGSNSNAFTSYDMTAYYGTVSSDKLEALLLLEADRMRHARIDHEQLESEKRVVISELQGYDNSPDYRLSEAVMRRAFPDHPYGLPVGGTKADVERFTVEAVRSYYQRYYRPDNAVLVVTGDFDPHKLEALVDQSFGKVQPSVSQKDAGKNAVKDAGKATIAVGADRSLPSPSAQPSLIQPIHLKQPGSAALIEAVYPIPDVQHPDIPALDVMDAVLSVGRNSRFFQRMVEPGLAAQVGSYSASLIEPGWYNISVTLNPGETLAKGDRVLLEIIQAFQETPISTEELQRAKTQLIAHFVMSNRDIDAQASQLAYNQVVAGDYRYSDRYLQRIAQVSVADVQRVAQTYLNPEKRTVGYFEPTQLDEQGVSAGVSAQQTTENFSPGAPVDPAVVAQYLPPLGTAPISKSQALPETFTLENGLQVLLLSDQSSPTVTLNGHIQAGNGFDLQNKAGVASLTAETLMGGTSDQDARSLAKGLEDRGASLNFSSFREGVEIEGHALSTDLTVLLKTLGAVLQNATFPAAELELSRQQEIASTQMELDDPAHLARRVLQQKLYPPTHSFHPFPTVESFKSITQADLLRFYQERYTPQQTVLTLVGDFDRAEVRSQLQDIFGDWRAKAQGQPLPTAIAELPKTVQRVQEPLPGKTQAVTHMGYPGIQRQDPRFYAALVLNYILGGDTLSSRLGTEIRDRQGLTYGIYSYFAAGQQAGPFVIEMQTSPEDTEKAIQSTLALLHQLRKEGVSEAEFKTAKRSIINSYPVELASLDTVAQRILSNAVEGISIEEIRDFPRRIDAVTMAEINDAIQALVQPDHLLIVTAGPVS